MKVQWLNTIWLLVGSPFLVIVGWRVADGLLLLFGCGFLIVSLMGILMPHLH
jgi:hypothetical protein